MRGAIVLLLTTITAPALAQFPTDLALNFVCPTVAAAGSEIACELTLTNLGPAEAVTTSATVRTYSLQSSYVLSATSTTARRLNCQYSPDSALFIMDCSAGVLAPGETASTTLRIQTDPAHSGEALELEAFARMRGTDFNTANDGVRAPINLTADSDVSVIVGAPATAVTKEKFEVVVTATNAGPTDARGFVTYEMPEQASLIEAIQSVLLPPCAVEGRFITCERRFFAPRFGAENPSTMRFLILAPSTPTIAVHTATVSASADRNPANDGASTSTSIAMTNPTDADVSIVMTAPRSAAMESDVTYSLRVHNGGPGTARGVTVIDELPPALMFVSASSGCTGGPSVTCQIPDLAPDGEALLTIVARTPTGPLSITNRASVSSASDRVSSNNSSSAVVRVVPRLEAGLSTGLECFYSGGRGRVASCELSVGSNGPADAENVRFVIRLPEGFTFTNAAGGALSLSCAASAEEKGVVTCTTPVIVSNAFYRTQLNFSTDATTPIDSRSSITVEVSNTLPDPNPADNISSYSIVSLGDVDLVTETSASRTRVKPGETVVLNVRVRNNGPDTARSVEIQGSGGRLQSFVTPRGTCFPGQFVLCRFGDIAAGEEFTAQLTLVPSVPGQILYSHTISTKDNDRDRRNDNNPSVLFLIVERAETADVGVALDGNSHINVRNQGPDSAETVVVEVTGVDSRSFRFQPSPRFACGFVAGSTSRAICTTDMLATGATESIAFSTDSSSAMRVNVRSALPDPNPANNTAGRQVARRRAAQP